MDWVRPAVRPRALRTALHPAVSFGSWSFPRRCVLRLGLFQSVGLPPLAYDLLPVCRPCPYGKARIQLSAPTGQISRMNWKSIRLELGRTGEFPAGSVSRAYLVRLPLDDEDKVDSTAFLDSPSRAIARRHWSTEPDERGFVVQAATGWAMRCDGKPDRLLRLDSQPLRLGCHVSVVEPDGAILPFRIASVR